jgi:putative membrane protein
MKDLELAIAHHLLIFALAGVLAFELGAVGLKLTRDDVERVAKVDLWYGILAAAIIVVGFTRAYMAAKGWAYYSINVYFWAKIGFFAIVGLLSIVPTVVFIRWRRRARADAGFSPGLEDIRRVRRYLWAEAALFGLIPVLAAAMARGYGEL